MTHAATILRQPIGTPLMVCDPIPVRMSCLMGREAADLMPGKRVLSWGCVGPLMMLQDLSGDLIHIDAALADNLEVCP